MENLSGEQFDISHSRRSSRSSARELSDRHTEPNSTELRPIIRKDSPASFRLRKKKRSEPVVRYSKSVYEPTTEIEPLVSVQKAVSNDHIVIGLKNKSSPIDIPKTDKPQSSGNLSDSFPKMSPRIESAQSWSKLFTPLRQTRLSGITELDPTPESSTFLSPESFDNISLCSLHEKYGREVKVIKPKKK